AGRHPLRSALHRALAAAGPDDDLAAQLDACSDQHSGDPMLAARALCRAAELTSDSDLAAQRRIGGARYAWLAGRPHQARLLLHAGGGSGAAQRLPIPALILDGEIELRAGDVIAACDLLLSAVHQAPDADRSLRLAGLTMVAETVFHTGQERLFPELARQAAALRHPGESPEEEMIFEYFAGMGILFSLDRSGALPHLNRAMALASELDDCRGLLRGSLVGLLLGDDPLALRMASRARTLAASSGQAALIPQAGLLAGLALFARGRYGDATVLLMESQRLAERSGLEVLVSEHLGVLATLAAIEGDHQLARARLDLLRERGQGQAQGGASMAARWTLAILDLLFGDPVDATRQLLQVVGGDAISGNVVIRMAATPYLVEAATLSGAREVARQALGQFDGWATRTDNPVWLAFSARGHALVAEDEDEAEESFERARHYHLRAGSDFELARTALLRGRRLRDGHRLAAAEQSIALANEIFDRLGARVWAEWAAEDRASIAAKLAAEPGAGRGAGCPVEELLTAQELRIARMAAQGATNREIAAQLFLSSRTVEYHLYKTFAKLGVRSRVELAGLVV
ncbi:MAG: hypothetical protein JXA67_10915, partial [Micromonosporaceae bacterium]|nr:hypothetical protein [Micromonosporaceae bacterium]